MSLFHNWTWALGRTLHGIFHAKALFALALTLAGLTLSIPVFLGTLSWSLSKPLLSVPILTEITVFTERSAGASSVSALSKELQQNAFVDSVRLVKKEEALAMVNKNLGLKSRNTKTNPLPDILIVSCASDASSTAIKVLAEQIEKMPSVDSVAYDSAWASHISALKSALLLTLGILAVIVAALVISVLVASVQLTTNTERTEIRALYLFGANKGFIKRPYVLRGSLTLMLSALLSLAVTKGALVLLIKPLAHFAALYSLQLTLTMPPLRWCALYVLVAALLGFIVSSLAVGTAIRRAESD